MKLELQKGSRSRILAGLLLSIVGLFVIRLFYLQIIQHQHYVDLANSQQIKTLDIHAKRGIIYALDGAQPVPLVLNQTVYTMVANPATVTDEGDLINTIEQVAGGNAKSNLKALLDQKETRYQVLATKLTLTQANKIKQKGYSGVIFQAVSQRVYPEGVLAAQALGFVNDAGQGQYGIEQGINTQLTGKNGLLKSVTDISDVPLTIGDQNVNLPAVDGTNIVMSIDRNIQAHTEQALAAGLQRTGATNGSVIVMDPNTGRVIAMANFPTFDPANYSQASDTYDFNNPTISAPYEPGSDIKTFTFATAIEKGVVTPDSTYNNTDYINVDDATIQNATKGQTGIITIQHAYTWSLNTGFVTVAERLGDGTNITDQARNTMYDYFHNKFGLGALTGIELSGEAIGTVIPPTDPQGNAVRYSNMSFGQGLDATMIQVISGFSSVINGGHYYKPTVVAGSVDSNGNYKPLPVTPPIRTTISGSTSAQMRTALQTARGLFDARHDTPGYIIGGKTGTSQVAENGIYASNETVGTYVGFGGNDTPKYAIMIQLSGKNKELQGERDAMPVFTDISNWLINYLKIQPKG
jgi:cell division protein FtsI (penicillin-binding protein 3)